MAGSQASASASSSPSLAKPASARKRSGDPRVKASVRPDPRKRDRRKLVGKTVPRIFTPPLAEGAPGPCGCGCALTEATTRGFAAVEFAEEICKVTLRPWQRWLLIHALETLPDGTYRFQNILVLVARQNGKSTLSVVLSLWAMVARGVPVVLSTAQDLDTAEEIWQAGVNMVEELDDEEQPVRPDLYELKEHVSLVNGKKALVMSVDRQISRWKVKAASRKAGRGLSGDLIILDELREQQNWEAWSAITYTTMARPMSQVWCFSNAGDISSVVLRHLRLSAHEALGDPDGAVLAEAERIVAAEAERLGAGLGGPDEYDLKQVQDSDPDLADIELDDLEVDTDDLFIAEWSAAPDKSKWDRDGWEQANPSLGYGDITERKIASKAKSDPEWKFRTEALCQWPDGAIEGIYPPGAWEAIGVKREPGEPLGEADRIVGDVRAAFDVAIDGSKAYIAWCGKRADGELQGEIVAAAPCAAGTDWIGKWLLDHAGRIEAVSAQGRGSIASDVLTRLQTDPKFTIPITPIEGPRLTAAHSRVSEWVTSKKVRHLNQGPLNDAVAGAKLKQLSGSRVIDQFKSTGPTAAAIAWEFAVFECTETRFVPPPPPPPKVLKAERPSGRRSTSREFDPVTSGF